MARSRKKRREGGQMVRRLTARALREFWEELSEGERPLKLCGEEICTAEELLAAHAREPRRVDRELAALNRATVRRLRRRDKEIDAERKVKPAPSRSTRSAAPSV